MTLVNREMKVIIKIIILVTTAATLAVSENIDCEGKSFHCVNSTHFMICVDFGAGVSSTLGNYLIPCPPSTECRKTNRFECEFPKSLPSSASVNSNIELLETTTAAVTGPVKLFLTTESASALDTINVASGLGVTETSQITSPFNQNIAGVPSDVQFSLDLITVSTVQDFVTQKTTLPTASGINNYNANNISNTTDSETIIIEINKELKTVTGTVNTTTNISTIETVTYGNTSNNLTKSLETTTPSNVNVTETYDFKSLNISTVSTIISSEIVSSNNDTLVSSLDVIDNNKTSNINNKTNNDTSKKNNVLVSTINDNITSTIPPLVNDSTVTYNMSNYDLSGLENTNDIITQNETQGIIRGQQDQVAEMIATLKNSYNNTSESNIKTNTNKSSDISFSSLSTVNSITRLGNKLNPNYNITIPIKKLNTSQILNSNYDQKSGVNNTFLLNKTNIVTDSNITQKGTVITNNTQNLILNGNETLANIALPSINNLIDITLETTTEDINKAAKATSFNSNAVIGKTSNIEKIVGVNNIANANNLSLNNTGTSTNIDILRQLSNVYHMVLETTTEGTKTNLNAISKPELSFNNNTYKNDLILNNTEPLTNMSLVKKSTDIVLETTTEGIKKDTSAIFKETPSFNTNVHIANILNTDQIAGTYNNMNTNDVTLNSTETNATDLVLKTTFKDQKNYTHATSNQTFSLDSNANTRNHNVTLNITEIPTIFDIFPLTTNATDRSVISNQTITIIDNANITNKSNIEEMAGPNNNMNTDGIFLNNTETRTNIENNSNIEQITSLNGNGNTNNIYSSDTERHINIAITPQITNATVLQTKTEGILNDTSAIFNQIPSHDRKPKIENQSKIDEISVIASSNLSTDNNSTILVNKLNPNYNNSLDTIGKISSIPLENLDNNKTLDFNFRQTSGVDNTYLLNKTNVATDTDLVQTDSVNKNYTKNNDIIRNIIPFPSTNNIIDITIEGIEKTTNAISNKTLNSNAIVGNIPNIEQMVGPNNNMNINKLILNNTIKLTNKDILPQSSNTNNNALESTTEGIKIDRSAIFKTIPSLNNDANIGNTLNIEQTVTPNNVKNDSVTLNNTESLIDLSALITNASDTVFETKTEGITYEPGVISNQTIFFKMNGNNASYEPIVSTSNNVSMNNINLNITETHTMMAISPSITNAIDIILATNTNGIENATNAISNQTVFINNNVNMAKNANIEVSTNNNVNISIPNSNNSETHLIVAISTPITKTTDIVLETTTPGVMNDTSVISNQPLSFNSNYKIPNNSNIKEITVTNNNMNTNDTLSKNTDTMTNIDISPPKSIATDLVLEVTTGGIRYDTQSIQKLFLNSYANIKNDSYIKQMANTNSNGSTNAVTINKTETLTNNVISSSINSSTPIVLETKTIDITNEIEQITRNNNNMNTNNITLNNTELLNNTSFSIPITNATDIVVDTTTESITTVKNENINANMEMRTGIKDTNNQILNSTVTRTNIRIPSSIDHITALKPETTTEIIKKVTDENSNITYNFNKYNQKVPINLDTNNIINAKVNTTTEINFYPIAVDEKQNTTQLDGAHSRNGFNIDAKVPSHKQFNNTFLPIDTTPLTFQRDETLKTDSYTIIKNINDFTNASNYIIMNPVNLTISAQTKIVDKNIHTADVTSIYLNPISTSNNKTTYNSNLGATNKSSQSTLNGMQYVGGSNSNNESALVSTTTTDEKQQTIVNYLSSTEPKTNNSSDKAVFSANKPGSIPLNVEQSSHGIVYDMTVNITTTKLHFSNNSKPEQEAIKNSDNIQHLSNFTVSSTDVFKNIKENITQTIVKENNQVNTFEKTISFGNNGTTSSLTNKQVVFGKDYNVQNMSHNTFLPNPINVANKGNSSDNTIDIQITKQILSDINKNRSQSTSSSCNCYNKKRGRYSDKEDCSKYYICIGRLEPVIGKCPVNTVFSEITKQCTKNTTHCAHGGEFKCTLEGRFNDILNKKSYFICVANGKSFVRFKFQCQNGYYLDRISVKCIKELDLESQKQVSVSTDNSKSETSINDEIDDENINLDSSNGDANDLQTRFRCVKEGKFSDSNDCRKYYVCTKTINSEFRRRIKKCDKDEVFHKDKKECVDDAEFYC